MVSWETFAYWAQFSAMTPLDRENILSIFMILSYTDQESRNRNMRAFRALHLENELKIEI